MRKLAALAALAAVLPGAAHSHVIEQITGLGQWVEVDRGVKVEPLAVIQDSRCPADVQCAWAGQVVISARVNDHGHRTKVRLTLGQPLTIGKGRLTLDQVMPEKRAGRIDRRDYRFGFSYARALPAPGEAQPL